MPRRTHKVQSSVRASKHVPPAAPIVAHDEDFYKIPDEELNGRLTVVTHRKFVIQVPHSLGDGWKTSKTVANPINQLGPVLAGYIPVVTSNDRDTLLAAFNKRLNTVHDDDLDPASFKEAAALIAEFPQFPPIDENLADRNSWLDKFSGEKRLRMEKGLLEAFDLSSSELGAKDISVKVEALLKRNDQSWAARIICAGSDSYNAVTGPMASITMKRMLELLELGPIGGVQFKLGYRCSDVAIAEYLKNSPHLEWAEGDYSRNDREQRKGVHKLYSLFLKKLGLPKWYVKLEESLSKFTVRSRSFGLFAKIMNQLPTGSTITTTRNSFYNMIMFAVACKRQKLSATAVVLGDDLLAKTKTPIDLDRWVSDVATFRMVLKAKRPRSAGEATFLSRRLISDEVEVACTMPLLGKALARFNVRANNNQAISDKEYMAGKCLSYAYEFRHVPFMVKYFLQRHVKLNIDCKHELEMTWFTRSNGVDQHNVFDFIDNERVLISDDQFNTWCMETYGMGLDWIDEICSAVILSNRKTLFDHPGLDMLEVDM